MPFDCIVDVFDIVNLLVACAVCFKDGVHLVDLIEEVSGTMILSSSVSIVKRILDSSHKIKNIRNSAVFVPFSYIAVYILSRVSPKFVRK